MRFNPPPGWPPPPPGFVPGPGWRPDPSWPPPPAGWQLWVPDEDEWSAGLTPGYAAYRAQSPSASPHSHRRSSVPPGSTQMASPWQPAPPPPSGTSGMAIAAFVLGLVGVWIVGLPLGIVALRRIRRTFQQGRGLAIAGIVLSCGWLVLIVLVAVIALTSGPPLLTPSSSAPPASASGGASSQSVDPFSLTTGDCFDNPTPTAGQAQTVTTVVQTACTQPHNAQIFATFNVTGSLLSYPGDVKMRSLATSGCTARVRTSLDGSKLTGSMSIRFLYPLESSWLGGHRTISCIVYNPTATLTSSLLKS